jgi:hypothetical protein
LPHSVGDRLDIPSEDSQPSVPMNVNATVYHPKANGMMDTSFTPAKIQGAHLAQPELQSALAEPEHRELPHPSGTVVLDVASGQVVPEFLGKPLRVAVQMAQQSGIELEVIGSGVAREQSPAPGTRVPAGSKVAVRFMR